MTTKLVGILTDIFATEQVTQNFRKRVFWLKQPDTERYPQHWEIELHQDDVGRLDQYRMNDRLEVEVEIRGKLYGKTGTNQRIFISLKATAIKLLDGPGFKRTPGGVM